MAVLLISAFGVGAGPTPQVQAASPAPRVMLGGTTTVRGSTSSVILVRVPREARVYADELRFEGSGPYVGIALTQDVPSRNGPTLWVGEIRSKAVPERFWRLPVWHSFKLEEGPAGDRLQWKIPAGDYRMYLITLGRPARATIRFRGLPGTRVLRPRTPASYRLKWVESESDLANLYYGGAESSVRNPALVFDAIFYSGRLNIDVELGHCVVEGPATDFSYYPYCPDPSETVVYQSAGGRLGPEIEYSGALHGLIGPVWPATWHVTQWVASASLPEHTVSFASWLSMD